MKKLLILTLAGTLSISTLVSCKIPNKTSNNENKTQKEETISNPNKKIEAKSTDSFVKTLADLMGSDDKTVVKNIGEGNPVGNPVTSRVFDTKVFDEDTKVYINFEDTKVFDISVLLSKYTFDQYEEKLTKVFGEKTSEEKNTLKNDEGRRADIWKLKNGSKLSLIQVNKTISISIQK